MSKIRKFAGAMMLAAAVSTIGFSAQLVEAKTIQFTTKIPSGCTFDSAWERTRNIIYNDTSIVVGELCYGYNTVAINEDYVWTRSVQYKHKSYFANGSEAFTSAEYNASAGSTWAKLEKRHTVSTTTYGIQFTNATDGTKKTDFTQGDDQRTTNKK